MADERRLTDDEAAVVFRRATEVELELAHRRDGWDVGQLEAVGREAGILPAAIHQAVAEVRLGPAADLTGPVVQRWRLTTTTTPEEAQADLSRWLHDELFRPVRDRPGQALFERPDDDATERRLERDSTGRYRLKATRRVAIAVADAPGGGSVVRVEAESATTRARRALATGTTAAVAEWLGCAVVVAATPLGLGALWVLTPVLVAGGGAWGWWRAGIAEERAAAAIGLALDGALDRLER